jgi:hypothetical protein
MYCTNCGENNDDNAYKCVSCGKVLQHVEQSSIRPPYVKEVPSYLAHAILATLFCCLPFGIVAIVYAAQVNGKLAIGDYAGAVEASENAKKWCWVSLGVWLAGLIIFFVLPLIFTLPFGFL